MASVYTVGHRGGIVRAMKLLALVNHSNRMTDAQLAIIAAAVQTQVARDFAVAWGLSATSVIAVAKGHPAPPGSPSIAVIDVPDVDGALGYHTDDGGVYDGFVFCNPVLDNGGSILGSPAHPEEPGVASVISHEVLELLGDPTCNRWIDCGSEYVVSGVSFTEVADEKCDPCEGDGYVIGVGKAPVVVSNFLLPTWFDPLAPTTVKTDFMGKLRGQFSMDAGGYIAVRDVTGSEQQVFGHAMPEWKQHLKHSASRRVVRSKRLATGE
jgi:hypothetical protein